MADPELFAGIAVADLGQARHWYERLAGRPPDFLPNDNEAVWHLGGTGWIYVVGDAGRAGNGLITVLVEDLDARVAVLAERGLETEPDRRDPGRGAQGGDHGPRGEPDHLRREPGRALVAERRPGEHRRSHLTSPQATARRRVALRAPALLRPPDAKRPSASAIPR